MRLGSLIAALALCALVAGCGSAAAPGRAACSWREYRSGTSEDLTGVAFPDRTHGWAVGGIDKPVILATGDGGRTWHAQHGPGTNGLAAVSFPDPRDGWAVGIHNTLLSTTDGGRAWRPENAAVHHDGNLSAVAFLDRRHGWIAGDGGLLEYTADAGRTWSPRSSGTSQDVSQIQFADARHGWLTAGNDSVLATTDGGASWRRVYNASGPRNELVAGLFALDARHVWSSGSQDDGESNHGVVDVSADGGRTWSHRVAGNFDDVRFGPIAFTDTRHGWVTGYQGELWYSDDGGASWGSRPSPTNGNRLYAMTFRNARDGWAVGQEGSIAGCQG